MAKKRTRTPTPPSAPSRPAKPQTGPTRREAQRAAATKAERRASLRRKLLAVAAVGTLVAAIGAYVVNERRGDAELRAALTGGSCTTDTRVDPTGPAGQNHVPSPAYTVDPPAGGDHLSGSARAGVYRGDEVPPDGLLVHSLEHGYVIVWHSPDLPDDQVDELEQLQQRFEDDVIVVERRSFEDTTVAATAWGQRLLCERVETPALERFAQEYIGKGPEDVPRG